MFRACLAFVFASVLLLAASGFSQTNSERASQVPATTPIAPPSVKDSANLADSAKAAAKVKRKTKAKADKAAAKADARANANAAADSANAANAAAPAPVTPTAAPASPAPAPGVSGLPTDTSKVAGDTLPVPTTESGPVALEPKVEPKREHQDLRLFNDPPLIAKEYGFGILGSVVAGALGFYIGSGIETAIEGESNAHKGTLTFTGIRYDNFYGAFYGGATGILLGSALTTYFVGQTDEEDGGLFMTLAGTAAAAGGAFYVAHLMGANDDIDWKPFIPLLAIPSLGGTLGFNVSRWFQDRKREKVVGSEASASVWLHPPRLAWGRDAGGDRLEIHALNLTF